VVDSLWQPSHSLVYDNSDVGLHFYDVGFLPVFDHDTQSVLVFRIVGLLQPLDVAHCLGIGLLHHLADDLLSEE